MVIVHDVEQGSEAWLKLREGLYTGSNADKLLSYATSFKIIAGERIAYALTELSKFGGNFWTKRGHLLEDEAIALYEDIKHVVVARPGMITNTKYPGCGYSPDGWPPIPLLEVKCFDVKKHMELIRGRIPLKVLAQIHFGLLITERPYAELIAYCPRRDPETGEYLLPIKDQFKIIRINRSPAILANFRRILKKAREYAAKTPAYN